MSDRLWCGPTPMAWADVNLCEHQNAWSAIRALMRLPGPRKVSGPETAVADVRREWDRRYAAGWLPGWLNPEAVQWRPGFYCDRCGSELLVSVGEVHCTNCGAFP